MKKTIFWIFFAILSGFILGKLTFDKYEALEINNYDNNTNLFAIKYGSYNSYEDMTKNVKHDGRYIYIEEDGLYTVYVALCKSKDNASKLLNSYDYEDLSIEIINIENEEFIQNVNEYEKLLSASDDKNSLLIVENQIISCYIDLVVKDE